MNPFSAGVDTDFPDSVSGSLTRSNLSKQCTTQFNTAGTLLAVGCSDGCIAIYDFETRAVAKVLKGHTQPVIALSWSRSSHHLLSASIDGLVIRWNVLAGTQGAYGNCADEDKKIKTIHLHPTIDDLAIINYQESAAHEHPLLTALEPLSGEAVAASAANEATTNLQTPPPRKPRWTRYISTPYVQYVSPTQPTPANEAEQPAANDTAAAATASAPTAAVDPTVNDDPREYYTRWHSTVAIFDHSGRFIFEGNSKGSVLAYQLVLPDPSDVNSLSLRLLHVESNRAVSTKSRVPISIISSLVQSPCGRFFMANNANQLKVYRFNPDLMSDEHGSDEIRQAHCEKLLAEEVVQQVLQNGARISLELEREGRRRKERQKARLDQRLSRPTSNKNKSRDSLGRARPRRSAGTSRRWKKDEDAENEDEKDEKEGEGKDVDAGDEGEKEDEQKDGTAGGGGEDADRDGPDGGVDKEDKMDVDEPVASVTATKDDTKEDSSAVPAPTSSSQQNENDEAAASSEDEEHDLHGYSTRLPMLLEFTNTFTDQVNRVPWRKSAFSHSSDFIIAGSAERGEHRIHIWSIHSGQLTKILLGPTEGLIDLVSHPNKPILVTCCTSGVIYIWNKNYVENWSAFAPDFEELDDNQEYVEKEDEFDIVPLDTLKNRSHNNDAFVDILTVEGETNQSSLITLPTTVLPDPETQQAYLTRKQLAREAEAQRLAAAAAAATSAAASVPMDDVSTPAHHAQPAKRSLEESTANGEEEAAKRIKVQ